MQLDDMVKVIVKGKIFDQVETRNIFTYRDVGGFADDVGVASALESYVFDHITNTMGNQLSNFWSIYETETLKYQAPLSQGGKEHWIAYHSTGRTWQGAVVGDMSGYQPALLLTFKTRALKTFGRKFIAGVAESMTLEGSFIAAVLTAAATLVGQLMQNVNAAGADMQPGLWTKYGVWVPFTSGVVGSIISSQRRRKPGYGI